jgi:hypothetical protein
MDSSLLATRVSLSGFPNIAARWWFCQRRFLQLQFKALDCVPLPPLAYNAPMLMHISWPNDGLSCIEQRDYLWHATVSLNTLKAFHLKPLKQEWINIKCYLYKPQLRVGGFQFLFWNALRCLLAEIRWPEKVCACWIIYFVCVLLLIYLSNIVYF